MEIKIQVEQPESIRPAVEQMMDAFRTDEMEAEDYMEMIQDQQVHVSGHVQ